MAMGKMTKFKGKPLAKNTKKQVRKIVQNEITKQAESKIHQLGFINAGVDTAGVFSDLTSLPRGPDDGEREGNQILPLSIRLSYRLINGDANNFVRVIVFRWLSSSAPVLNDILDIELPSVDRYLSGYNTVNRQEFNILYDKIHTMNDVGRPNIYVLKDLKLGKRKCYYNDAGASNGEGHIWMMRISDSAVAPNPVFEAITTLRYRDM